MKRILKVTVVRAVDTDPDTSYLGEYSNNPGEKDRTIDWEERGDMGRGEYRYFVAAMSGEQTGNPESVVQDYERMEGLNRQQWCYLGIFVRADVQLTKDGPIQKICSGGLWGIESDSDRAHFQEVQEEELSQLRDELKELGFTKRQIDKAFSDLEEKYE